MSIIVNMMEADLADRLARATGEDPECCSADLLRIAENAKGAPGFQSTVARARALSDPTRLLAAAVVRRRGEACGCEIQAALGVTHATVSHHMRSLVDAGIVTGERRGKWTYYSLTPEAKGWIP